MAFWMRLSFLFLLSFFASVIITGSFADVVSAFFVFLLFFLLLFNFGVYYLRKRQVLSLLLVFSAACFLGVGITFSQMSEIGTKEVFLSHYFLEPQPSLKVKILSLDKEKEHDMVYIAQVVSLDKKSVPYSLFAKVIIDKNLDVFPGDTLSFSSRLIPFSGNYRFVMSQREQNTFFQVYPSSFQLVSHQTENIVFSTISSLRQILLHRIHQLFPEKEASFLAGILIGARESIDSETMKNFNNSGLSHLIAVSGFNITLIILFLTFLLQYFPPIVRMICIFLGIVFFVLLVGFSASVVRAACMGFVAYGVTLSGRQVNIWALLLVVLFGFALYSPLSLLYNASLQLSFLAILGIAGFYPIFEKYIGFLPSTFGLKESILMTFSASLTTLPILLLNFGQFSLVAPLTNLLVGWTIPLAMLFGALTILVSFFSLSFSGIPAFISFLLLRYTTFIVDFFGAFSWSIFSWRFTGGEEVFCCLYFASLYLIFSFVRSKKLSG